MFYKLLAQHDLKTFEKAASELLSLGYEPVGAVSVSMIIVGQNKITGQHEMAQVFVQGFIGENELQDKVPDRNNSPLITT